MIGPARTNESSPKNHAENKFNKMFKREKQNKDLKDF